MMGDEVNADTAVAAAATISSGRNNMIGRSLMLHKLLLGGGNWDVDATDVHNLDLGLCVLMLIKAVQGRQNLVFWNREIFDEPFTMAAAY